MVKTQTASPRLLKCVPDIVKILLPGAFVTQDVMNMQVSVHLVLLPHHHHHPHLQLVPYPADLDSSATELASQSVIYLSVIMFLIVMNLPHIILHPHHQLLLLLLQHQHLQHALGPAGQASRTMAGVRYNVIFQNVIMILTAMLLPHPQPMNTYHLMKILSHLMEEIMVTKEEDLLHLAEDQDSLCPTLILAEWHQERNF
jgi:hypothetical protein